MALPLNIFKTVTKIASTTPVGIYTAPTGYSGVVLLSQATNVGNITSNISFSHRRTVSGIAVTTEIVKNYAIPTSDSANLLFGRLILEQGDVLVLSASDSTNIKFIGSVLETLN